MLRFIKATAYVHGGEGHPVVINAAHIAVLTPSGDGQRTHVETGQGSPDVVLAHSMAAVVRAINTPKPSRVVINVE